MVLGETSSSHLHHMYRASIGILRFVHLFKGGLLDESAYPSSVTQYGRFSMEGWGTQVHSRGSLGAYPMEMYSDISNLTTYTIDNGFMSGVTRLVP